MQNNKLNFSQQNKLDTSMQIRLYYARKCNHVEIFICCKNISKSKTFKRYVVLMFLHYCLIF